MRIRIRSGLDVSLPGAPRQEIGPGRPVSTVAVLGEDYRLHRANALVDVGDRVRLGQPLIVDQRNEGVVVTSPGAGTVTQVERGERRTLRAIVLALEGSDEEPLERVRPGAVPALSRDEVITHLTAGGLWSAIRVRPFHRIPSPASTPDALFVTATDTNPLAARPDVVIAERSDDFARGLAVVATLTDGPVFLCTQAGTVIPRGDPARITTVEFTGPHPAGLVGTHVHHLHPVSMRRRVWHVGYQDVIAIGRQLVSGRHCVDRVVALSGPVVREPRLVRTRLGASVGDLLRDELLEGPSRIVSGSVLAGRQASGWGRHLGRHHLQVCVVPEPGEGAPRRIRWTTARHGRPGPMLPTEDFERVLPLDLLPTPLLRALVLGDDEAAADLGCLELDEEDLALCTYVCPAKLDYGPLLTRALERIEGAA